MSEEKKESAQDSSAKDVEADDEKVEVPAKFKGIVEEVEKMSVLDLAELVKILEKKFGVSAASAGMVAAPVNDQAAPGGEKASADEGKSEFNIELKEIGEKKIEAIKIVRDISGKGLKDAKDLVDKVVEGPQIVKENVKKEEAEEIKKKFEQAGAKVELR